jgi:hypothetical protein
MHYAVARRARSDNPEVVAAAVRDATQGLRDFLQSDGIDLTLDDVALLGHTESPDGRRGAAVGSRLLGQFKEAG